VPVPPAAALSGPARAAVFAPLGAAGRAARVTLRLTDAIALGLLRDGEQLPSESELADRLGVATATVREALTTLRGQGLVRTRRGRGGGSFVSAPGDPAESVLRARLREVSPAELRDLCDHYAAISGASARLAADRADADDLARIEAAAGALQDAADPGARRRTEGSFHVEVAVAAQSPRLTREEIVLQTRLGPLLWLPHADDDAHRAAVDAHACVVRAVRDGQGDAARSAVEAHVRECLDRVDRVRVRLLRA